jgi:hypothetical protein
MIRWHRRTYRDDQGVPILSYYTEDRDWRAWSIDRKPCDNGSRTYWYEYQPVYRGEPMGLRQFRLRDAKAFVMREGRQAEENPPGS